MKNGQAIEGHRPALFRGQRLKILNVLLEERGRWIPAYRLAAQALQYGARVKEIRDAGYIIENRTERVNGQVHGWFRLVSCPGEHPQQLALIANCKDGPDCGR